MIKKLFDKNKHKIYILVSSVFILYAFRYLLKIEINGYTNLLFYLLILYANFCFTKSIKTFVDKKAILFGFLLTFITYISNEIYLNNRLVNFDKIYKLPVVIIGIFIVYYYLFLIIKVINDRIVLKREDNKTNDKSLTKKRLIIMILVMIFVYFVCYFSFFPGLFNYDMIYQNCMASGICKLSSHHPVLHTMIWKVCLFIGKKIAIRDISIICYSFIQIFIVILIYFRLITWQIKNKWSLKYIYFTYVFFLLNPLLHVFSFSPAKDVYFSCFLLLFLISIYDSFNHKKYSFLRLGIYGLMSSLFRNNFIYALLALCIILLLLKYKKQVLTIIIIVVVYFVINNLIFIKLNIEKPNVAEKLSIPLVQLSYTASKSNVFNDKDLEILKGVVPKIYNYNPRLSDTVKNLFYEDYYNKHKKEFWQIYFKGLKKNPKGYIVSALNLDIQFWYYDAELIDPYNNKDYIEDKLFDEEVHNNIPLVFKKIYVYYSMVDDTKVFYMNLPILNFFFTLSFNFYLILFSLYISINNKDKNTVLVLIFLLLFLGTYLLGPIANFRYMYPFYFCLPFYLGLAFNKKSDIIK